MGFFDNLSKKATETYKATTDKTNKVAKEMRIKSNIAECRSIINNVYTEIGKKVYEKHILGESINIAEDLKAEIAKADEFAKKVDQMNEELRALNNLKLCSTCAAQISLESKFCPKCGAKQEEAAVEVKEDVKEEPVQEVETIPVQEVPAETIQVEETAEPEAQTVEQPAEEVAEQVEELVENVEEPATETPTEQNTEETNN